MIAVRPINQDGSTGAVQVVQANRARVMIANNEAVPANGPEPAQALPEGLPRIDTAVDVLGLTDRDPEFFEKQAAAEKDRMQREAQDRMQRTTRTKGR